MLSTFSELDGGAFVASEEEEDGLLSNANGADSALLSSGEPVANALVSLPVATASDPSSEEVPGLLSDADDAVDGLLLNKVSASSTSRTSIGSKVHAAWGCTLVLLFPRAPGIAGCSVRHVLWLVH